MKAPWNARDLHIYGGLVLGAVGGCAVSWPWTLVVIGTVLALLGIFGPFLARRGS